MVSKIAQKFNQHIAKSIDLQRQLRSIKSPFELIQIAKQEGFELNSQDLKELAQIAYQKWLANLHPQTRLFFEKVHFNPELDQKLHQCKSIDDLMNLAAQCGWQINYLQIEQAAQVAKSISGFSFEKIFFQNLGIIK